MVEELFERRQQLCFDEREVESFVLYLRSFVASVQWHRQEANSRATSVKHCRSATTDPPTST